MDTLENAGRRLVASPTRGPLPVERIARRARARRRRRRTIEALTVLVVAGLATIAVTAITGDRDELVTVDESLTGDSLGALLAQLPPTSDGGAWMEVSVLDTAAIADAWGIGEPGSVGFADAAARVVGRDTLWSSGATNDEVRAQLGIDPDGFEWLAQVGYQPGAGAPDVLLVAGSDDIDPAEVDTAVRAVPVFGPRTRQTTVAGHSVYRWTDGDPNEIDVSNAGGVRGLGRSNALAVTDGWMAWTVFPDTATATVEARTGTAPTLAEDPTIRRLWDTVADIDPHGLLFAVAAPAGNGWEATGRLAYAWRTTPTTGEMRIAVDIDITNGDTAVIDQIVDALAAWNPTRDDTLVAVTLTGDLDQLAADARALLPILLNRTQPVPFTPFP
ncbi:MAG TPA: hypothetical protein VK866_14000, partial [Acidimicrobiales bacterium]|nr:hypothetical protein [Acidimicrobiales bacterium]